MKEQLKALLGDSRPHTKRGGDEPNHASGNDATELKQAAVSVRYAKVEPRQSRSPRNPLRAKVGLQTQSAEAWLRDAEEFINLAKKSIAGDQSAITQLKSKMESEELRTKAYSVWLQRSGRRKRLLYRRSISQLFYGSKRGDARASEALELELRWNMTAQQTAKRTARRLSQKTERIKTESPKKARKRGMGISVKKMAPLTPEQQALQRRGFSDGASVPGSNLRKIDK